jgi:hypothetical protein
MPTNHRDAKSLETASVNATTNLTEQTATSNFSLPFNCVLLRIPTGHEARHVQKVSRSQQVTILSVPKVH